ncbi:hypothetical protein MKW92_003448 [Papaver armeniacum]|nr:hypothetical protein MKW92_003448 [Papaver armeniacum]
MAPNAAKRPRVSKSEMSSSQLFYETEQGSHEFKINGYSHTKGIGVGKYRTSGKFTVGGYDWMIRFYPDGDNQASEEYISMFIELASPGEVKASFEINLLDQRREGQFYSRSTSTSPITFKTGTAWSEFETSNYLKDDRLSIHGTVSIVQTRFEEGKRHVIPVPPSDMIQNLKGLLKSEIGSDVTFQVASEEFRAHKSILAARSLVFKAMFFGLVGNPDMETVVVEELDPFAFRAMLLFLYSDELPETHELSDSDSPCTSTTIMRHLLTAADRYNLARLRQMCEAKLYEDIAANNVAETLALAELHQCLELKTACLKFAAKPENLNEVMQSDGYADLEKSLVTDLLKTTKRPRVSKSEMSSSQSFYEIVKGSHEHKINGYSLAKEMEVIGQPLTSGKFIVGGYDWVIRFYPNGFDQASEEYISLLIRLESPVKYMKRSEFETSNYLKDDRLSIHGTVSIVQIRFEEEKRYVIPVPQSDMIQNLKSLLKFEIGYDITFQVANEKFRAHKLILAARSPVFKAMFFGLVGNPDMETVVVEELDPFSFKAMLLFLYSDELPETHELSDSDSPCTSTTIMRHVLTAADRYNLARLRQMCEAKLYEDIAAKLWQIHWH